MAADGTLKIDVVFGDRVMRVIGLPAGWEIDRVAAVTNDTRIRCVSAPASASSCSSSSRVRRHLRGADRLDQIFTVISPAALSTHFPFTFRPDDGIVVLRSEGTMQWRLKTCRRRSASGWGRTQLSDC